MVIVLSFPVTTGLQAPLVSMVGGLNCAAATPQSNSNGARCFIAPCYHLSVFGAAVLEESWQLAVTVFPDPSVTGLHGALVSMGTVGTGAGACDETLEPAGCLGSVPIRTNRPIARSSNSKRKPLLPVMLANRGRYFLIISIRPVQSSASVMTKYAMHNQARMTIWKLRDPRHAPNRPLFAPLEIGTSHSER